MILKKIIKEKERFLAKISLSLIKKLIANLRADETEPLMTLFADTHEVARNLFPTFHFRPKLADDVNTFSDKSVSGSAFVLQGPLLHKDNFTVETVKIYRRLYPKTIIIVSTWDNEDIKILKDLEEIGAEVIVNKPPVNPGLSNVNYQIVSSLAGVKRAAEKGADYVLKCRADQRFYMPNVDGFLVNMLKCFPPSGGYKLQQRILGISLNSFKYRMYGLSDVFVFGSVSDMLTFWDCPLDPRTSLPFSCDASMYEHARAAVAEVYLTTKYLEKIGYDLQWNLADSWKAFAEVFCVVDRESIDLYWPKYSKMEYWHKSYDHIRTNYEMTFLEWLNIYQGLDRMDVPEHSIKLKMRDAIPSVADS